MWLIAHFENVKLSDFSETCCGSLEVIKSISHVTFSGEDDSFDTLGIIFELFGVHHRFETFADLVVVKLCESYDSTS